MVPRRSLRLQQISLRAVVSFNPELQVQFASPDALFTARLRTIYLKNETDRWRLPYTGYITECDYKTSPQPLCGRGPLLCRSLSGLRFEGLLEMLNGTVETDSRKPGERVAMRSSRRCTNS